MIPHVSIVVVHYEQTKYTLNCLQSLSEMTSPDFRYQILLVDNGSTRPFKLPQRLSKLPLVLLRSDSNLGFTGGNNLGIHQAIERFNSQYVLLLNNDTTVAKDAVTKLYRALSQDSSAGIAGPMIYFTRDREFHRSSYKTQDKGKVVWYAGGCIDWTSLSCFHRGVDEINRGQFDHLTTSDFVTGCAMLIKREVLEKVGFLDKKYFVYYEDADFSLRTRGVGYRILFVPQAEVWHSNAGSSGGSGSQLQVYYQERNRLLLASRHGNLIAKKAMLISIIQNIRSRQKPRMQAVWHFLTGSWGKQPINI